MEAWVRYVGVAIFALQSLACSDKGDSEPSGGSGATGSGGTGSGGSGGGGTGNTAPPVAEYNFGADLEGWAVLEGDGASVPDTLQTDTMAEHSGDEGNPDAGSIKVTVPFTGAEQQVSIALNVPD